MRLQGWRWSGWLLGFLRTRGHRVFRIANSSCLVAASSLVNLFFFNSSSFHITLYFSFPPLHIAQHLQWSSWTLRLYAIRDSSLAVGVLSDSVAASQD
ncbi:hypothetical protein F4802DRAFT_313469 [Xylaria palmicola]|nr:hypothetical protein F4802DRAFT_313469 [Xylaria palmicola]